MAQVDTPLIDTPETPRTDRQYAELVDKLAAEAVDKLMITPLDGAPTRGAVHTAVTARITSCEVLEQADAPDKVLQFSTAAPGKSLIQRAHRAHEDRQTAEAYAVLTAEVIRETLSRIETA